MKTLVVAALLAILAMPAQAAGFDCAKAARPIEKIICGDPVVDALDTMLNGAYKARRAANDPAVLAEQRQWLASLPGLCRIPTTGDPSLDLRGSGARCLAELYEKRLTALGAPPHAVLIPALPTEADYPRLADDKSNPAFAAINRDLDGNDAGSNAAEDCAEHSTTVTLPGARYLSLVTASALGESSDECGPNPPISSTTVLWYDLKTGSPVDWRKLLPPAFAAAAADLYRAGLGEGDGPSGPGDGDTPCAEIQHRALQAWPDARQGGLVLRPDTVEGVPAALTGCAVGVLVPTAKLRQLGGDAALLDDIDRAHAVMDRPAAPPPPAVAAGALPAGTVHPLCLAHFFGLTGGDPTRPVSVEACNRRYAQAANASQFTYRNVGRIPDGGDAVVVSYRTGGEAAAATALVALRRHDGLISVGRLVEGGDHCNGAITGATPGEGGLDVVFEVGPVGFSRVVRDPAEGLDAVMFVERADPVCFGTVVVRHPHSGGPDAVLAATALGTGDPDDPCLGAALAATAALAPGGRYAAKDFAAWSQAYDACIATGAPPEPPPTSSTPTSSPPASPPPASPPPASPPGAR